MWQVIGAVAAAAITVAIIIFGVRFGNQGPLPAESPTTSAPVETLPSSQPTPSQSQGTLPTPDAKVVKPGLSKVQPAPTSANCDLTGVITTFDQELVPNANALLGENPWMETVIGCSDEWALVYPTDAYFYAMGRPEGLNSQLIAFNKAGGKWSTNPDLVMTRYFPGPGMAELGYVGYMNQQFTRMGIPLELREQFVGNEWGPATFVADGLPVSDFVNSTDGAFRLPLFPGWSMQQEAGIPSGAFVNAEGNIRILLGKDPQLGGACGPDRPRVPYETFYSAPITINGGFAPVTTPNARIVVRGFTEEPYRVAIGIDRLGTDADSGESCVFYLSATDPTTRTGFAAASSFFVDATPSSGLTAPDGVMQFDNRSSLEQFLRSEEFDQVLLVLTLMTIQ